MMNLSFAFENPLKSRLGDEFFRQLPTNPGVYFFLDEKRKPLYVGKADSLRKRLASYKLAKPGTVAEHTLEMIEHAREIIWEVHETGAQALARENELIRTLLPPFNVVGTHAMPYLYCGLKLETKSSTKTTAEFRLTHKALPKDFKTYGCFLHRGRTKAGYSAILRLLASAANDKNRFSLPAKLCRTSPAYVHTMEIPTQLTKPLKEFLAGKNTALLSELTQILLAKENVPPYLYAPLQRDFNAASEFFRTGPQQTRKLSSTFLTQRQMEKHASEIERQTLVALQLPVDGF